MINLPKPSQLTINGKTSLFDQVRYLVTYLTTLVTELERLLGGLNISEQKVSTDSPITNISYFNNKMIISRADGSEEQIGDSVLWSGAHYMQGGQTITLAKKVSEQTNGIVLLFSAYEKGAAANYDWQSFFVPKYLVANHNNGGSNFTLTTAHFSYVGTKYLYIQDKTIAGNSNNNQSGTRNGITYANNHWVLRYVIGV